MNGFKGGRGLVDEIFDERHICAMHLTKKGDNILGFLWVTHFYFLLLYLF